MPERGWGGVHRTPWWRLGSRSHIVEELRSHPLNLLTVHLNKQSLLQYISWITVPPSNVVVTEFFQTLVEVRYQGRGLKWFGTTSQMLWLSGCGSGTSLTASVRGVLDLKANFGIVFVSITTGGLFCARLPKTPTKSHQPDV